MGRSNCDVNLEDDQSISRVHAKLYLNNEGIEVEDVGSKYGVFVNRSIESCTPLGKSTRVRLKVGDVVRFGRLENVWRLAKTPIECGTSTLGQDTVPELRRLLSTLSGKLSGDFTEDCTHLVMPNVTITQKGKSASERLAP